MVTTRHGSTIQLHPTNPNVTSGLCPSCGFRIAGRVRSPLPSYPNSSNTRSGRNGSLLIRTPVASKIAFAIAAGTGRCDGSPAP